MAIPMEFNSRRLKSQPLSSPCLKPGASRSFFGEFPERVNEFYRKDVLWSSSYFIASCRGVTVSILRKYIENQDSPKD
ncbi:MULTISPECIES: transposase, partial [unclassified Microcoleus]|uniref:transposase n=1 Tax=unclassified Microcoleus TaxID=2642155 RepID=UPI0025E5530A